MAEWTGKSKGSLLGYKIFVFVLKSFGVSSAYFILRFVAGYFCLFSFKSTQQVYKFLRYRIGFNNFRAITGIYKSYFVFGKCLLDRFIVMAHIPNTFTYTFEGEEHLHSIAAAGEGGILLSAHVGNWEVAGHLLTRIKAKVNVVMMDAEHQKIKSYLESMKERSKLNVIAIKDDISHIYEISAALERKELVCIHGDRYLKGNKTVMVDFLGQEAPFPIGPMSLVFSMKVPVTYVFAIKESNKHYHFYATEPKKFLIDPSKGNARAQLNEAVKEYAKAVENKVKEYPYQWFNYFDFWAKA